jgi:aspartate aminotransferase
MSVVRALPKVSRRALEVPASPIRKLMPVADDAKRRGVHVHHLNIGQPDLETPLAMRGRLKTISETVIPYSPSAGTREYLESLQRYYANLGVTLGPNELIATTGGSEAVLFAFMACADPGDEALVVEPFYTNYRSFAALAGVKLVPLVSLGEDGFHLPPRGDWEAAITPRTRLVILCNPNNPTGTVYTKEELTMVAEVCRDHGLFLVSDEVYRELAYDGRQATSAHMLRGFEELVIVVDSLSKRFSACGIRLGSISTRNQELFQGFLRMAQGRLSPPGLAQMIAVGAADLGPDYYRDLVAEYQKRRDVLYDGLSGIPGVFLRKPEGAFYFVARLPIGDSEDFARWLLADFQLEKETVMVAPAPGFYATPGLGRNEVRIAYVLGEEALQKSVRILAEAIPAYAKKK